MLSDLSIASIQGIFTACAFCLGCCIGSFMNVVVWRLPRGESLIYPPSHCPKCNHAIRAWENIPIISWLCLRARCSNCHLPISVKYPLGEAATGVLYAGVWLRICQLHLPLEVAPGYAFICAALLAASLIDVEHHIVPDEITVTGFLVALALAIALPASRLPLSDLPQIPRPIIFTGFQTLLPVLNASRTLAAVADCLLGALFGFAPLYAVGFAINLLLPRKGNLPRSSEAAIGGGDLKLLAMLGAFLGPDDAILILLGASLLAIAWFLGVLCIKRKLMLRLPWAPFISVATLWLLCFRNLLVG